MYIDLMSWQLHYVIQTVSIGLVHMIVAEKGVFSLLEAAFAVRSTIEVKQQLFEKHHPEHLH